MTSEIVSPGTQESLAELRYRARNEPLDLASLKCALALMRGDRSRAAATSGKARTVKATAKKGVDTDGLLDELENL